jgi:carbonic anhydrase
MLVLRLSILITAMFAVTAWGSEQQEWSYEGTTGPLNWGKLAPGNVMCEIGRNQAPINIEGALTTSAKPLQPGYASGSKDIVNNGHTIQVDFEQGNTLVVDNATFSLQQMHFHAPSENQIAGQSFPMEAHFVHADAQGNLLVVALMFREGEADSALNKVWAALPPNSGPARPLPNAVTPMAFMPKSMSYYRFSGSLTTPPCSEGVRWLVLKTPVSVSKAQIEAFEHTIRHHNNRPLQPLNGRVVIENQ